ncbi:MAG TPA: TonB family protein [Vicinamibacteria bacterium]|nr:TonB family protein [Vicinamibacteria bacterium]
MEELRFGRYEVRSMIGQGAMGKVYGAYDPRTKRPVAVKVIKDEILSQDENGDFLRRFQREARAAGSLSHPNIITVFDVGENYFVMEYLEGETLSSLLAKRGPLSLDETLQIVTPIADALAFAHGRGICHRDIKPANIMVSQDGRPIITDFGLAHLESTVMTTSGQFLGSPSYMSPEQIRGDAMAPSADLYSLSVVTYEMLTGRRPFSGENITTLVYNVVNSPPCPPHEHNPSLPRDYHDVFVRALAKDPGERFASFSEFVAALNGAHFDRVTSPRAFGEETLVLDSKSVSTKPSVPHAAHPGGRKAIPAVFVLAVLSASLLVQWYGRAPRYEVRIQTDPPGARVVVDGKEFGPSPVGLQSLGQGKHTVRVTKEGFLPLEEVFELTSASRAESLDFALQPANVILFVDSTPPGAAVTIDGSSAGSTPLEEVELEAGQHEVLVARDGYETWRSVVAARGGETVNLVARMRSIGRGGSRPAATSIRPGQLVELGPDDKPARRITGEPPGYPREARRLEQQGRVTLEFVVTDEGVPIDIRVVESAGSVLDDAVRESVAKWRFEPAEKNGVKVSVKMRIRHTFRLGTK